jgi:hypothetical protein
MQLVVHSFFIEREQLANYTGDKRIIRKVYQRKKKDGVE